MIKLFSNAWPTNSVASSLILGLALCLAPIASQAATQETEADSPAETKAEKKVRKEAERMSRVEAFVLKKKSERDTKQAADQAVADQVAEEQIAAGKAAMATDAAVEAETVAKVEAQPKKVEHRGRRSRGSSRSDGKGRSSVDTVQKRIWQTEISKTPRVRSYLELIDSGDATAADYATFGNMIATKGLVDEALVYYNEAQKVDPNDPRIWMNMGTLQQRAEDYSAAAKSFANTIKIDPANALAHYNLGVSLNEMNEYDEAIEEFKLALTLDPELADPKKNPQVVNNGLLLPVQLEIYQRNQGTSGIQLMPVTDKQDQEDNDSDAR